MAYTQEDFQEWIFWISDKMDRFTNEFAEKRCLIFDYTLDQLNDLERWILNHYFDVHELIADSTTFGLPDNIYWRNFQTIYWRQVGY